MAARDLRPADAARLFGVSSQTFNGWKARAKVSADQTDAVIDAMRRYDEERSRVTVSIQESRPLHAAAPKKTEGQSLLSRAVDQHGHALTWEQCHHLAQLIAATAAALEAPRR